MSEEKVLTKEIAEQFLVDEDSVKLKSSPSLRMMLQKNYQSIMGII